MIYKLYVQTENTKELKEIIEALELVNKSKEKPVTVQAQVTKAVQQTIKEVKAVKPVKKKRAKRIESCNGCKAWDYKRKRCSEAPYKELELAPNGFGLRCPAYHQLRGQNRWDQIPKERRP